MAVFAALRLAGTYIPIDFYAPISRSSYILNNAEVDVIITTFENANNIISRLDGKWSIHQLNSITLCAIIRNIEKLRGESVGGVILYTSGSTGFPKGVMLSETAVMSFVNWGFEYFKIMPGDVIASIAPFHFDLSILTSMLA